MESTCSTCHNSGSGTFGEPLLTWTISDVNNANISSYIPGQTYNVTLAVTTPNATTAPAAYGFSSVFLDDTEAPDGGDALTPGSFSNLGTNVRTSPFQGRTYIEQSDRTESGIWTFDWTAPAAGFGEVRIYSVGNAVNSNFGTSGDSGSSSSTIITLQEAATLPVTLSAFSARSEKTTVYLDWETSLEENADRFEVERSANGTDFDYITEVSANGRSTRYSTIDENVLTGDYFYRLRMVDLDGTAAFSPVVAASVTETVSVRAWPNPTAGSLNVAGATDATYRLLNTNGAVVRAGLVAGETDLSGLKSGIYLLEATTVSGRTVQRIVKQ